jgi:hypothetical protein
MDIQNLINTAIKEENDARPEKEQRHWYISRLGQCPTGQYLERLGREPDAPFDDRTLRVFKCGTIFEDFVTKLVAQTIDGESSTQFHVENQALDISGYVDLVLNYSNGLTVPYEIKSKHSKAFWYMLKEGRAQRHHEIQLWWYLKLMNLPLGMIVYVSKDDLAIKEYPVQLDDLELAEEAQSQLQALNEAWSTKQVPEPLPDPKDWRNKYCSWHLQCVEFAPEVVNG